ncbi:MAG: hypothetical protein KAV87_07760, partial [Desulfobacteraceae bacterium]|nr:hypothetical protein [Desulfobacteraceae bacterium]
EIIGADLDSSESFWSYPIYSYEMTISSGVDSDRVVCTIKHAEDFVEPDYQGTEEKSRTYIYRLDKDEEGNYNGNGEWLKGDPGDLHPQSVWVPIGIRQKELFLDYEEVRKMARTIDDELEGEKLVPGHHFLIVYPGEEDAFTIQPLVGENITCYLALDRQSAAGNGAGYRFERNNEVVESGDLDYELHELSLNSETGADKLQLRILPGPDNSAGVCVHLYVDVKARYQSWFYGFPSEQYWTGCAVVSTNESEGERAWLEIVGDQGLPLGRGDWSGESLKQGGHWLSSLENGLTVDYFSSDGEAVAIKLVSSTPYQSLLLAGDGYKLWGPPESSEVIGSRLVIPWLTSAFNMRKFATLHLANQSAGTVGTVISYYKNDGTPQLQTVKVELAPQTMAEYSSGNYPGQGGVDGWGVVESSGDDFSGAVVLKEGYNLADQLPLLLPGRRWIVPHLATDSGWQTRLGICNPNPEPLALSLTAFVDGEPLSSPYSLVVEPFAKHELAVVGTLFGVDEEQMNKAWLHVDGDFESAAYLRYRYDGGAGASIPLYADVKDKGTRRLPQLAVSGGWWTGIVLVNRSAEAVSVVISALNEEGEVLQRLPLRLEPKAKYTASAASIFQEVEIEELASLRLEGAEEVKALVLYGGFNGVTHLAAKCW